MYVAEKVEGVHSCPICYRILKSADSLESHLWSLSGQAGHPVRDFVASESTGGSKNKCAYCPRWFGTEEALGQHLYALSTVGEHPEYVATGEWAKAPPKPQLSSFIESC